MNSKEQERASTVITEMFCNFPQSGDLELNLLAYLQTVKDEALADIEAAVLRFRRGEVPGWDAAFSPTGPQFYREVKNQSQVRAIREKRDGNVVPIPQAKSRFLQKFEAERSAGQSMSAKE